MSVKAWLWGFGLTVTLAQGGFDSGRPVLPPWAAPLLPGIGTHDPRTRVDPDRAPWRALGKVQAAAGGVRASCTGTLVAPFTVLTAAHCLFNVRTARYYAASSIFFLAGLDRDRDEGRARVRSYAIGSGYDPRDPFGTIGSDWALLTVDHRLGTPDHILKLSVEPAGVGTRVMLGGYGQDHAYVLMADLSCRIIGMASDRTGRPLLRHDCAATRGVSGAPLLVQDGNQWRVAGMDVAAKGSRAEGVAVILDSAARQLESMR